MHHVSFFVPKILNLKYTQNLFYKFFINLNCLNKIFLIDLFCYFFNLLNTNHTFFKLINIIVNLLYQAQFFKTIINFQNI